jgi:hypothetical protein
MEQLARDFADRAHCLFIYTREAHPGEVYPHHTSLEQKTRHAAAFRQMGLTRPILIDSLDGQVHRTYGGVANMSWIVDHTGHVAFKASWTDAADLRAALQETLQLQDLRRKGSGAALYYREIVGLRRNQSVEDDSRFLGGKKAAEDFRRAHRA